MIAALPSRAFQSCGLIIVDKITYRVILYHMGCSKACRWDEVFDNQIGGLVQDCSMSSAFAREMENVLGMRSQIIVLSTPSSY